MLERTQPKIIYCPKCGQEMMVKKKKRYCPQCGYETRAEPMVIVK